MGVAAAARAQYQCSTPGTWWHFPALPPSSLQWVWPCDWVLANGIWAKEMCATSRPSRAWSFLSFSVWTWMDWALRKVEPGEGRAWVLEWLRGESPLLTYTGLCCTRRRHGIQPLKAGLFGTALGLLWLVQRSLTNQSSSKYSQNIVYLS